MIRWKKLTEEIPNHPCMYTFSIFILLKIDLKIPTLCYFSNNDRHRMVTAVLVIHFFSNPLLSPHWNIQNRWTNCLLLVRNIHFRGPHTFQESNALLMALLIWAIHFLHHMTANGSCWGGRVLFAKKLMVGLFPYLIYYYYYYSGMIIVQHL